MPKEDVEKVERRTSSNMGHNRPEVTHAYIGTVARRPTTPGRRIDIIQLTQEKTAMVFMNPMPICNLQGRFEEMSAVQRERTAIHIEIYRPDDGENPALTARVKSFEDFSIGFVEELTAEQIQQLRVATVAAVEKKGYVIR